MRNTIKEKPIRNNNEKSYQYFRITQIFFSFMENFYNNALYGDGRANTISEVIQEDEEENEETADHELQRQDNSVVRFEKGI